MIFQHTWKWILGNSPYTGLPKTQTSRIVKPKHVGYTLNPPEINAVGMGTRMQWVVGSNYAVQPGRGKQQVARIQIVRILQMDVRDFSDLDIQREGFSSHDQFFELWDKMHNQFNTWVLEFALLPDR